MSELQSLKPRVQLHVMDLVHDAGIDVSDWGNFRGGPRRAKSNPRYCYNWSFISPDVVVLNLWYDQIIEQAERILVIDNMAQTSRSSTTKPIWKKRADEFDKAIQFAVKNELVVRVILNEGQRRQGNSIDTEASRVNFRLLDPKPWKVIFYDNISGKFILAREAPALPVVDQFSVDENPQGGSVETFTRNNTEFLRNPIVRKLALERAGGNCEYCGQKGFLTHNGFLFLETHHVIPLSESGPDDIFNVAAVCPNCHREAHYGTNAKLIRSVLLKRLRN